MGNKKILCHVDAWAGVANAGSERYINTIMKYMIEKGHEVHVLTNPTMAKHGENRNGIVFNTKILDEKEIQKEYEWADFVCTQIAFTPRVLKYCKRFGKRLIYLIHNNHSVPYWDVKPKDCWLVTYCADWIQRHHNKSFEWKPEREMTFYPPVLFEEYAITDEVILHERNCISLVNRCMNKGVLTLNQAAQDLPEYKFLAVKGSYSEQVNAFPAMNIELVDHTDNMRDDVYARSKIVIMPSKKETWGMVAIEAMCSGIPVVAHPTEGLVEACGDAGIFVPREKGLVWKSVLKRLMTDEEYYAECSKNSLARALELNKIAKKQLAEFEEIISNVL